MSVPTVKIASEGAVRGDVGPCNGVGCKNRATQRLLIVVRGIAAHTWVCDEHLEALR